MPRVGALEQVFREQLDEVVTGPQGDLARGMEGWAGGSQGVSKEKVPHPGWLLLPKGSLSPRAGGSPDAPLLIQAAQHPYPAHERGYGACTPQRAAFQDSGPECFSRWPWGDSWRANGPLGPSLSLLKPRSVPPGPFFLAACWLFPRWSRQARRASYRPCAHQGLTLGLMLCCQHLEILHDF